MAEGLDKFRQLRRDKVSVQVLVSGVDVSSRFNPRLLQLSIIDPSGGVSSQARLELDDRLGQIKIPEGADRIVIELGWPHEGSFNVFDGRAADVESRGQKNGGRILCINAQGQDLIKGKSKTPMRWSLGDGTQDATLGDALQKAAGLAGLAIRIDPQIAAIKRKFWMANNESFQAVGDRIANEVGGIFKITGQGATLTKSAGGVSTDGQNLTTITAQAGVNLIGWEAHPNEAKAQWKSTGQMFFDVAKGAWKRVDNAVKPLPNALTAAADFTGIHAAADEQEAEQKAQGDSAAIYRKRGYGWVVIDGEPQAQARAPLTISGARPGVDGSYKIDAVEHFLSRQTGYISRIDFELGCRRRGQRIRRAGYGRAAIRLA